MRTADDFHGHDWPFRYWIWDRWCAPCRPLPPDLPWEAEYANDCERGKRTLRATAALPPEYREAFAEFDRPDTIREWGWYTGVTGLHPDPSMHGAGLHVTDPGGWLQVHVDYERHPARPHLERRLSVIVFLHPEWRPEWGGQLLLCDPAGRKVAEIDPWPGRLVAFENGPVSYHGVRRTSPHGPPRVSAAAYFLAPARPQAARTRALFIPNRQAPACPTEVA
jgi:hypothetical protein